MWPGPIVLSIIWLRLLRFSQVLKQPFIRCRVADCRLVSADGLAVCALRTEVPVLQRCARPAGRRVLAEQVHPAGDAVGEILHQNISRRLSLVVRTAAVIAI